MPMDPISFWVQSSVFWARIFKMQHEAYLEMLCRLTAGMPHPSAQDLAEQAQAHNVVPVATVRAKRAEKPAPQPQPVPEPVTA
jgi:hypothetical protein